MRDDDECMRRGLTAPARVEPCRRVGRVALSGATVVGVTGLMLGCGSDGILAALPMPAGSLIEPLSPLAFPGPGGIPLTPASWAKGGVASKGKSATASNAARVILPITKRNALHTSIIIARQL